MPTRTLSSRSRDGAEPYVLEFDVPELAEAARDCEAAGLYEQYGLTRQVLDAEFGRFEEHSVFITIRDDDGVVHAAARYVVPGPEGLKSLDEMQREPWHLNGHAVAAGAGLDLTTTWDVASLTRRRGSTVAGAAAAISHGIILASRENGVTANVAILNETVRRLLATSAVYFRALPGAATLPFDGSPASTPVYAPLAWQMSTARRRAPDLYRKVGLGEDLPGIRVAPAASFRVTRPHMALIEDRIIDLTALERQRVA